MESLHARVERAGPLAARDAVGWVVRLCKRIEELHRLGVAHGGLSAHCVLTEGPSCQAAGMLGDVREAAMRPAYHCPERLAGGAISTDDDTWAATVMVYFLLTGAMPFSGTTAVEIRRQMARAAPSPLAVFDAGDDNLQAVLDTFLDRDPSRRGKSISALRGALEQWRGAEPLPPLEDGEEDSLAEFDDDEEENIATVMRDFSDVRAQLEALQRAHGGRGPALPADPTGEPARPKPRPAAGAAARPNPASGRPAAGSGRPALAQPRALGAPRPLVAPRPPPGGAISRPPKSLPPPPRPGGVLSRSPIPHRQAAVAPPAAAPSPAFDIDDEDSEEVATMLMDTEGTDLQEAIHEALAKRSRGGQPREHQLAPPPPAATGASVGGGLPGQPRAGEPAVAPAGAESLPQGEITSPPRDAAARPPPGWPSLGPGSPAWFAPGHAASPGAFQSPMGLPPMAPEGPPPRSGVRTALVVASVLLVLVVIWIGVLLLERYGLVVLPG